MGLHVKFAHAQLLEEAANTTPTFLESQERVKAIARIYTAST